MFRCLKLGRNLAYKTGIQKSLHVNWLHHVSLEQHLKVEEKNVPVHRFRARCASKSWSHSLHNIIKLFKLDILTQAIKKKSVTGWKSHRIHPLSMQPSTHGSPPLISRLGVWRLTTNKFFFTRCQGLLRGIRLFYSFQVGVGGGVQPHIQAAGGAARMRRLHLRNDIHWKQEVG